MPQARLEQSAGRLRRPVPWDGVADRLRASGLRWTPQRRTLVEVLREHEGHVTATELIARCRERDRTTTPSTVYRTLDVLEDFGLVRHGHAAGRPRGVPRSAGAGPRPSPLRRLRRDLGDQAGDGRRRSSTRSRRDLGFAVDLSHVTISGRCRSCPTDSADARPRRTYAGLGALVPHEAPSSAAQPARAMPATKTGHGYQPGISPPHQGRRVQGEAQDDDQAAGDGSRQPPPVRPAAAFPNDSHERPPDRIR